MSGFTMAGSRHRANHMENQDALYERNSVLGVVGALADGVSSCTQARAGARRTADAFGELLSYHGDYLASLPGPEAARRAVEHVGYYLKKMSEDSGIPVQEYASTMAGAFWSLDGRQLLTCNLGDGLILGASKSRCEVLAVPADSTDGCPVTTTRQAERLTRMQLHPAADLQQVVLCSDGAWRLMFQHGRLREDVKSWIQQGDADRLAEFLQSEHPVDDCTFLMLKKPEGREVAG